MPAQKPYLKLKQPSRRRIRNGDTLDGEFFFSDDVADSPCEAAFYIIPHKSEPMFKVGWGVAADRRLDKINEIWGNQLDIYSAVVIATSRKAAVHAEQTMKLFLRHRGWKIDGLPPLEGHSEFFSTEGLLYAYDKCMQQVLPVLHTLEERTHVITARGVDRAVAEAFAYIVEARAGKEVSADRLLANMIKSQLRSVDIPKIIQAVSWDRFPESVIAALTEALKSKYTAFAHHADELWTMFGAALLQEPKQFLKIVSRYGVDPEQDLLDLLKFIVSHKVVIKEQSGEWLSEILGALAAKTMVELIASQHIDVRVLTFAQRIKVFKKLFREKDPAALLQIIPYRLDDLDQLKAEAMDRWTLERHCGNVDMALLNLNHIDAGKTPKNFPAVLASLYFDYFDGLAKATIIEPAHWPMHEQIHLKTFRLGLSGLIENAMKQSPSFLLTPGPVFQKAVVVAMLDLYAPCFQEDEAANQLIMEDLARIQNQQLSAYFDPGRSADFAFIREALRQAYRRLMAVTEGAPLMQDDAGLQTRIEQLQAPLSRSEEGRYYAMYALQDVLFKFGDLVTAPSNQAQERYRSLVIQYVKGLWSLVHEEIIHHHYVFNTILLYLQAWPAIFELENVPVAHPQAVL